MNECGCVITHLNGGVSVTLCSAHGYGTDMLPILRRFIDMFRELEVLHGHHLPAAYTDLLHEAETLLRKIDVRQEQKGREPTESPAETQKVMDFPQRPSTVAIT